MKYVALLRGINVGGKNKVNMKQLKDCLSAAGLKNVSTYINSGNILFETSDSFESLKPKIEKAIVKEFSFAVAAAVVSQKHIETICKRVSTDWTNDTEQKTDVLFLWPDIDNRDILHKVAINPDLERVLYLSGALVWNIERKNVTKGNGIKLIKSDIYTKMTARNINTVRKIRELMTKL